MSEIITLSHGSGGSLTHDLIEKIFYKHFSNNILNQHNDAACISLPPGKLAFTTDSFVVSPIFFSGGNIGKLAICGTVNDLTASGAKPMYLSCGFIIEEGFLIDELEVIVDTMAKMAFECDIRIVAGDTKVVEKGACDGIFINTSGIGIIPDHINVSGNRAEEGDSVIITGSLGDHGTSILLMRENLGITAEIKSDCAPLNNLIEKVLLPEYDIHVLRDPTRGGVATTLNEIAIQSNVGIKLFEEFLPIKDQVRGVCELLGMDPLYMANEGKMIIILPKKNASDVIDILKREKYGCDASIIGEVVEKPLNKVFVKAVTGGNRLLDMLSGDQLPRIC